MFGTRIKRAAASIAIAFVVWLLFAPAAATATERPKSEAPSGAPVGVVFGEQYDPDLGMYYLRARFYSPQTGRFWSMDTWEGEQRNPITLNKYLYGNANPVFYTDPSGRFGVGGSLGAVSIAMNISGMQFDAGFAALDASRRMFGSSKWLDGLFQVKGMYDIASAGVGVAGAGVAALGAFKWIISNGGQFGRALKNALRSTPVSSPMALNAYTASRMARALYKVRHMFGSRKNAARYWNELQDLQSRGVIRITRDPGLPDQVSNYRSRPFTVNIQPGAENLTHAVAEELEHVQGLLRLGTPTTTSAVLREELRAKSWLLNNNSDLNWFDRIVLGVQMRDVNKQL